MAATVMTRTHGSCPVCARVIRLMPATGVLYRHIDFEGTDTWCEGGLRLPVSWAFARWPRADHLILNRPLANGPVDNERYAYCLAHRERVRWLANPMWWHHTRSKLTCWRMQNEYAPRSLA